MYCLKFVAIGIVCLALTSRADAQIVCSVIEPVGCPPVQPTECSDCFFVTNWICPTRDKIIGTETFVDGFRNAFENEPGFLSFTLETPVFCSIKQACSNCGEPFLFFGIPTARCSSAGNWSVTGDTYWILQGNSPCNG